VKNVVYQAKNNDLLGLKARIWNAVAIATHSMLQNMWTEVK
jgi:hypothetical protein